ncbi:hypothetical protein [Brevibacterium casei]|uniref:Uncharacterized protein n=1 Tax=Brevibacterium casei CIP 102111 TaxID=1255625 RepID=A0A2H1IXC6_9MICO|nr:hypothetical protein [Brevibacterium casei]QPR39561.1 hypothetical protein I6G94_01300 [Brevibacterium casei]QPR43726.1 hypothetical protein I6G93_16590 [Brevibacterium casei]SMX79853.1 hypothetical protein BC102111_01689 [Brevibacterium casei CIP 102111]
MARDHARVNVTIWQDADFRNLSPAAQHLYFVLWTHPDLTYCGVVDWRPGRLASLAGGWDKEAVIEAAAELSNNLFVIIDEDTEEALLRSWIKWDGLLKQPRLPVSMAKAYSATYSNTLRGVLTHELTKLRNRHPDLSAFEDERISSLLEQPAIDPKGLPLFREEFPQGFRHDFRQGFRRNATEGFDPLYSSSYSSSTTPAPIEAASPRESTGRKRPSTALPDDWTYGDTHIEKAQNLNLDVDLEAEKFRDNVEAKGLRYVDWGKAFHTWLNRANDFKPRSATPPPPTDLWERKGPF